jgi:hypothetical protein
MLEHLVTYLVHDQEAKLCIGQRLDERPPIPLVPAIGPGSRAVLDYLLGSYLQDTTKLGCFFKDVTACFFDALLLG